MVIIPHRRKHHVATLLPNPLDILGASVLRHWSEWDTANVTLSGGNISNVTDLSGNGNDLAQATGANQPLHVAAGMNGRGVGRFDGAAHYLNANFLSAIMGGTDLPFTVWAVINKDLTTDEGCICATDHSGTGGRPHCAATMTNAGAYALRRKDTAGVTDDAVIGGYGAATPLLATWHFSGTSCEIFENSISEGSDAANVGAVGTNLGKVGAYRINGVLSAFMNGDIAALAVANTNVSAANRQAVEDYFIDAYGL